MTGKNIELGKRGESMASDYLVEHGYILIEKNYRCEYGEIDLIAEIDNTTVFVEVKTRTGKKFGNPEDAITLKKQEHIVNSAHEYLQSHPEIEGDWRVDVISILVTEKHKLSEIIHFENAVQG